MSFVLSKLINLEEFEKLEKHENLHLTGPVVVCCMLSTEECQCRRPKIYREPYIISLRRLTSRKNAIFCASCRSVLTEQLPHSIFDPMFSTFFQDYCSENSGSFVLLMLLHQLFWSQFVSSFHVRWNLTLSIISTVNIFYHFEHVVLEILPIF